jgi:hypothetical protein
VALFLSRINNNDNCKIAVEKDQTNTMSSGIAQLFPILRFLSDNWKIIIAGGTFGALVGVCYFVLQPPVFQATVMISMAQVPAHRDHSLFANIEEPEFLVERLKVPSTYTNKVIKACENKGEYMQPESMERLISTGIPRAIKSVVFIRIRRNSPEVSQRCSNTLFEMIRNQQGDLVRPFEEDLKRTLNSLQKRHAELVSELSRAEKQERYETLFFAKRDELIGLDEKIFVITRGIEKITQTKLVAPVYISPKPISLNVELVLSATTLTGLFLGLLAASFRELKRSQPHLSGTPD